VVGFDDVVHINAGESGIARSKKRFSGGWLFLSLQIGKTAAGKRGFRAAGAKLCFGHAGYINLNMALQETEYRAILQDTFDRIEKPFDAVDPDIAECEQAMGAMTIRLADGSRCILSAQPSVRQLWLALAARGTAYHFNYDESRKQWVDDKGRDIELLSFLTRFLAEAAKLTIQF
jgi:iron donor protein CyaY